LSEVLATLLGALIGAVGVLVGVMVQRHFERRDKAEEDARRKRSVAKALFFEVKGFYYWLQTTASALAAESQPRNMPPTYH
jgi:hypothetical protein